MLNPIYIKATTLPDAWHQSLYNCFKYGREYKIDSGSFAGQRRLELDYVTINIPMAGVTPLLPEISPLLNIPNPVSYDYLSAYLTYLMTNHKHENEEYTYGERLCSNNQLDLLISTYKKNGYRNNQMILQIGKPSDMELSDPPCLRHIDTKIQDDTLHFFPYFRSWDLYNGFPANLGAIEIMKQYCAEEIGVKNGSIIASSKGLHLYDYTFNFVKKILGR